MSTESKESEAVIFEGVVNIPFTYAAGKTASKFLLNLRDKKLLGKKCRCGKVFCPPRPICPICFNAEEGEWIEMNGEGTLLSFTVVKSKNVLGIIKLDEADNNFLHLLGGFSLDRLKVGMRVKVVFSDNRAGNILDIAYFTEV